MTQKVSRPAAQASFLLVTYNQEDFVREAVQSAFDQTFEPLEIILSDDASTDGTFAVLQDMADAYRGPHSVRVVQNAVNVGVLAHVIRRGREAKGDLVIVAAGDDMSAPDRTAQCVRAAKGADAVVSKVSVIDREGQTLVHKTDGTFHGLPARLHVGPKSTVQTALQGCAAAYRRHLFDIPLPNLERPYAEDLIFSYWIALQKGQVVKLDAPLVKYRLHSNALSHFERAGMAPEVHEAHITQWALNDTLIAHDVMWLADRMKVTDILDLPALTTSDNNAHEVLDWPDTSVLRRLWRLISGHFFGTSHRTRWRAVRIFGRSPHYQPRKALVNLQRWLRSHK